MDINGPKKAPFKKPLGGKKFLYGSILILLAVAFLIYRGFQGATVYYLTVTELEARGQTAIGERVRITGLVAPDSIERPKATLLKFTIQDDGTSIPVVYTGVVPDAFKSDAEVVVEGQLTSAGVFEADVLLAKCPSKYEPQK